MATLDTLLSDVDALAEAQVASGPEWLQAIRSEGLDRFKTVGFPTTRNEEWRFTDVAPLLKIPFRYDSAPTTDITREELQRVSFPSVDLHRIVLVNGRYVEELSEVGELPEGVTVGSLADVMTEQPDLVREQLGRFNRFEETPFAALNDAFLLDGAYVHVPKGTVVETPIFVIHVADGSDSETISHPRNLFVADESAQVSIVERFVSRGTYTTFTNVVTQAAVAANAQIDVVRLQEESDTSWHISTVRADQAQDSRFDHFSFTTGGHFTRNDIPVHIGGTNVESVLNGLYILRGDQYIDNHTAIDHAEPHCNSWEVYKGILDDSSRAVFNGKVFVRQKAQKTDAKQTNRNLLLSDDARVNTKPQLEIFADDVKCTHGAVIGQLEDRAIHYCRTRGIGEDQARRMLTYGFASDLLDEIPLDFVRETIDAAIMSRIRTLNVNP